jgi:SGNH domain (fused to AT3 domains)
VRHRINRLTAVGIAVALLAMAGTAGASSAPGTATQIKQLVAASHKITQVDAKVASVLSGPSDIPQRFYPVVANGCSTATQCVFGDTRSKRTILLFGDSHAMMWVPALAPAGVRYGFKLVVLWAPACPAADVSDYRYVEEVVTTNAGCAAWKAASIRLVKQIRPALVLIGERTAAIEHRSTGKWFSRAQWQAALTATIVKLRSPQTKVAVLQDLVFFNSDVPTCLASYPSEVQKQCSARNPNPRFPGQQVAEQLAARATGSSFLTTVPWFCNASCSPIVGNYVTYYNEGHVSATYAGYLSGVVGAAVVALLR